MMGISHFSVGKLQNNTALVLILNVITLQNEFSEQTTKSLSKNWDYWLTSNQVLFTKKCPSVACFIHKPTL